jgi:hypothetical protein
LTGINWNGAGRIWTYWNGLAEVRLTLKSNFKEVGEELESPIREENRDHNNKALASFDRVLLK